MAVSDVAAGAAEGRALAVAPDVVGGTEYTGALNGGTTLPGGAVHTERQYDFSASACCLT